MASARWLSRVMVAAALLLPRAASADTPTKYDEDPVGEGEADHKFALLLNPVDAALGVYGGEADFVLGDHVAVGVTGAFYTLNNSSAMALGAGLLLYPLRGALHGWYVDPQVVWLKPMDESPVHFTWSHDVGGFGCTSGYQWTWDYGFSGRLGAGAMYYDGGSTIDAESARIRGARFVAEGLVGWAFM